ncbi:hypothetical protein [Sphingomonas sp.]|uniref:hypothetical protein n=1 Tax=Sphingomonas sp. TaxID=28214 RepID=UPI002FD87EFC
MAVALLTQRDIDRYGASLSRCYRIDETPDFDGLLRLIDKADAALATNSREGRG